MNEIKCKSYIEINPEYDILFFFKLKKIYHLIN